MKTWTKRVDGGWNSLSSITVEGIGNVARWRWTRRRGRRKRRSQEQRAGSVPSSFSGVDQLDGSSAQAEVPRPTFTTVLWRRHSHLERWSLPAFQEIRCRCQKRRQHCLPHQYNQIRTSSLLDHSVCIFPLLFFFFTYLLWIADELDWFSILAQCLADNVGFYHNDQRAWTTGLSDVSVLYRPVLVWFSLINFRFGRWIGCSIGLFELFL